MLCCEPVLHASHVFYPIIISIKALFDEHCWHQNVDQLLPWWWRLTRCWPALDTPVQTTVSQRRYIIVDSRYIGIKVTYRPPLTSVDRVTYRLGYLGVPQLVEGDIQDLRANQHHLHLLKDFGLTTPSWRPRLRSPMEGLCTVTTCW